MIDRTTLQNWLSEVLRGRRGQPCTKIVLRHRHGSGSSEAVDEWDFGEEKPTVAALLPKIVDRIVADVEGLGATQSYVLLPFYGDSPTPLGRYSCQLTAPPTDASDHGVSEPPNAQGLVAQLMRHTELCMSTAVGTVNTVVGQQTRTIELQSQRLEAYDRQRYDNLETIEQLLTLKHDRDLEAASAANHERRMDRLLNQVITFMPAFFGYLTRVLPGADIAPATSFPAAVPLATGAPTPPVLAPSQAAGQPPPTGALATPSTEPASSPATNLPATPGGTPEPLAILRGLLASVREDQLEPLQRVLSPDQQLAFATLLQQLHVQSD